MQIQCPLGIFCPKKPAKHKRTCPKAGSFAWDKILFLGGVDNRNFIGYSLCEQNVVE